MITEYIDYLTNVEGYAGNTCIAYINDLRAFEAWALARSSNARWSTIRKEDVEEWVKELTEIGFKATTINRKVSALRGLYRYWMRKGMIDYNPARGIIPKKEDETLPSTIDTGTLHAAYELAEGDTKLIISLLYSTGIRLQEMLDIKWEDVDEEEGRILIHGKGRKERYVYIHPGTLQLLQEKKGSHTWKGTILPYGQRSVRRMLAKAIGSTGSTGPSNPHAIRHTAATQWAAAGASNTLLAKALGHSRIETSQRYVDLAQVSVKAMQINNNMFH